MAWTAPKTFVADGVLTAAELNTHLRDNLLALTTWASYTPTWTATGGTPTIGNGTLEGEYIEAGELCHLRIRLTIGSTTSISGTSSWLFSLPFASVGAAAGAAVVYDASASVQSGVAQIQSGSASVYTHVQGSGVIGATVPMTWATSDYMQISITYKVA